MRFARRVAALAMAQSASCRSEKINGEIYNENKTDIGPF
jgi:hypothetical protein